MKALITAYNKTEAGLILRGNFVQEVMSYDLKDFLSGYNISLEELNWKVKEVERGIEDKGYSNILEFDNVFVVHLRFIK